MKGSILLAFLLAIPFIGYSQDRESDSLVLVSIYQSLDGDNWSSNDNWLSDSPINEWSGVGLTADRVSLLSIKSTTASGGEGDFPVQVSELTELQTLEIKSININQAIPESLANLTKLKRLVLENCNLNGELPPIFDQFENLNTLSLSSNELTGPLPALPQTMYFVNLDRNQFSGTIPQSWIGNEAFVMEVHQNNLSGNYDILNTFPSIGKINVSDNNWDESTLPTWIDDIPNLQRFTCDGCNLIGEIPAQMDFTSLEKYSGMFLSDNNLSGDISLLFNNPEYGQKLYLRVRNNNFSGELPVHMMESFHELDVYNNQYSTMSDPQEGFTYRIGAQFNEFNYEGLAPVQHHIVNDSTITVTYSPQNQTGSEDTLVINMASTITLYSGDNHPNTAYQWYKSESKIEGENDSKLIVDINNNSDSGWYRCEMTNPDFPQLALESHGTNLEVDITTATENTVLDNITIYPNPTRDYLTTNGIGQTKYKYEIKSIEGISITKGIGSTNIDVSQIDAGVYILSIVIDNTITNMRFIKLK